MLWILIGSNCCFCSTVFKREILWQVCNWWMENMREKGTSQNLDLARTFFSPLMQQKKSEKPKSGLNWTKSEAVKSPQSVGMQARGPPHHPWKINSTHHDSKIWHHKPFQETPRGFFLTETQKFFSTFCRIYIFPFNIFCPIRYTKKWSLIYVKAFQHSQKSKSEFLALMISSNF